MGEKIVRREKSEIGITRLPVLEGEISHIEIPRTSTNLGITIVGGIDTALRCVVVQEVFAEGLVAQDGRLRPGDQIIEINGTDTTNASHHQVCQLLRKSGPVLRLGVYRERIEAYHSRNAAHYEEEHFTVLLERNQDQQLGVRLSGWWMEPGIFILEVIDGSPASQCGQFEPYDRIVSINGEDVQSYRLEQASQLIQSCEKVSLVVARRRLTKEKEAVASSSSSESDPSPCRSWQIECTPDRNMNTTKIVYHHEGFRSSSCEALIEENQFRCGQETSLTSSTKSNNKRWSLDNAEDIALMRYYQRNNNKQLEVVLLQQKTVNICKDPNESLGMRIGGGLGSNEGDIPIYIANIHPQGCIGRTQQVWKGDILLSVNGTSLLGLTHSQAVATLKSTVERSVVSLGLLEGPETSVGSHNFIPSWLYWQKLPRCLQFPRIVVLNRSEGASLGFSIVGGDDPIRGPEPIHVLFVVQESPAAKDGKLKCGDRLLAVDGHSLENVKHATAVKMLKQTGTRVTLEVVSWLGTEL
ncbi:ligand of Numb protein X 2-like [Neocloeon triangulifer]|uniref:ligand of Numb protein X 2-like n=1 Tax=Neocloeon triangulifer TaxID=2078957 RepID=UPI00286F7DF0|nr:ligand of Numb protein X 2-like [Neocloeon triangulifer]